MCKIYPAIQIIFENALCYITEFIWSKTEILKFSNYYNCTGFLGKINQESNIEQFRNTHFII